MIPALLLWLLSWGPSPDPGVTYYRVAYQAHYRTDIPCPTTEDPGQTCATYWAGEWATAIVLAETCGERCSSGVTLPYILPGEVVWFQLVAGRDPGCEGPTAWPPS